MSANPQHVVDTEDAAELNLGDDFRNETCLSNAEVAVILEKQKSDYETQEKQLTRCVNDTVLLSLVAVVLMHRVQCVPEDLLLCAALQRYQGPCGQPGVGHGAARVRRR
jgi:hypothetical protein